MGRFGDFPARSHQIGIAWLYGSILPEDLGGAGLGYIEYCIIIEELSRVDGSVGIILAAHTSLCANHIYKVVRIANANSTFPVSLPASG